MDGMREVKEGIRVFPLLRFEILRVGGANYNSYLQRHVIGTSLTNEVISAETLHPTSGERSGAILAEPSRKG